MAPGLPGGNSLAELLSEKFGVRNAASLPPLTAEKILEWADTHYRRTGKWPNRESGIIRDSEGEKWSYVDAALYFGVRGLSGVRCSQSCWPSTGAFATA